MKRIAILAFAGLVLSAVSGLSAAPTPTPTEESEGTISGMPIQRAQGGWLGIEIKDQCFRMTFYNDRKRPVRADVAGAVLWWPVQYQPNNERVELTGSDDPAVLSSTKAIRPPYTFKLHITLLTDTNSSGSNPYGAAAPDPESYVVDFSG
jgi:hypothetical protein